MSYLALARKWRPRTFSQLVGQDHITKALVNSLHQGRLHHAYLFTGTRGVGKTSVARLMAKALNCEIGISPEPCLKCSACIAIEQGRFIDLIEIDAASKTRVEDTRDILDNVQYAPVSGRYKIYLIDEVHMLSQHSFNALLKTLEEPPSHVKFLLATTDPQKLPITVLSRCLQFNLKNLPIHVIATQLQHIVKEENQPCEPDALTLLAKAAQGSMRDALSLLDQVLASAENILTAKLVKSILGYTQQDYALSLLSALAESNASELIRLSQAIANEGGHFNYAINELLDYLHQITVYQNLPDQHLLLQNHEEIKTLAQKISPQDIQLFYQIALKGKEDMFLAPSLTIGFEMTLLRMLTFKPAKKVKYPPLAYEEARTSVSKQSYMELPISPLPVVCDKSTSIEPVSLEPNEKQRENQQPLEIENWETILPKLKLTGMAQNAAENAEFIGKEDKQIKFRVDKGHQSLFTTTITQRIEKALTSYYGEPIKIIMITDAALATPAQKKQQAKHQKQEEALLNLENDPFLQQLQHDFSAELVKNSIEPVKDPL